MKNFCAVVAVSAALLLSSGHALAADPSVTDIKPIALHQGVNTVPGFGPHGETFTIVQAWRGNGNAHGHTDWLVLAPEAEGKPFGVVGTQYGDGAPADLIRDDPFDGERVMGEVVFAKAKIAGVRKTILIDAYLDSDAGKPLADHNLATIRIFQLSTGDEGIGTPDIFMPIATMHSQKRYCNVALAVRDMLGLPLAQDYAGPNTADGCF